jgi:hypothetical protein
MMAFGADRMIPRQVARRFRVNGQRTIIEINAKLLVRGGSPGNRTLNLRIKSISPSVLSTSEEPLRVLTTNRYSRSATIRLPRLYVRVPTYLINFRVNSASRFDSASVDPIRCEEDANSLVGVMVEFVLRELCLGVEHRDVHGYRQDEPVKMLRCQDRILHE